MQKHSPIPLKLIKTDKPDSFKEMPDGYTGLPVAPHPGSFGFVRKNHIHEGIDLYAPIGTEVYAMEAGVILGIVPFTGEIAGSTWWHKIILIIKSN